MGVAALVFPSLARSVRCSRPVRGRELYQKVGRQFDVRPGRRVLPSEHISQGERLPVDRDN
jgi:hypothetical protein